MIELALYGFIGITLLMFSVWIVSLFYKDASLVDRFWGLGFVLLSVIYFLKTEEVNIRHYIVLTLVCIWGLRLSLHIHLRNKGHGEDPRYQKMRAHHGKKFWFYSLFSVFLLQSSLAFLISAPILKVFAGDMVPFSLIDLGALLVWFMGFYFESVGDLELKKFKADPSNKGKVLNTGLWSLTRHPNYFGDAVIWWAFFGFALATPGGWMSIFGPLLMSLFLRYISGVTLLEKGLEKSKVGYKEYVANTPAFIPSLKKFWKRT